MGKQISPVINIKLGRRAAVHDVLRIHVRLRAETEGDDLALDPAQRIHGVDIVTVCDHGAGLGRNALGKLAERVLDVLDVLEKVQMIRLDVQNHGDRRIQRKERVIVLARLHDDRIALADTVAGVQQRKRAADHDGRVFFRRHHDVRAHGRRRRLAVCAGNTQRIRVAAHERAPCLRPLKDRDAAAVRLVHLRIVVMNGGRADHELDIIRNVGGAVADVDRNAALAQRERIVALAHVRAADVQPRIMQHLCQRRHGHAADTDQQPGFPGNQIILKIHSKHQISFKIL